MKIINELMELCGKSYIKKFGIALLLIVGFTCLQVYGWYHRDISEAAQLGVDSWMSLWFVYLFILILFWMHHRRIKRIFQEGSIHRMRLLPIPKMSVVYAELLYIGATYVCMILAVAIGFMLGYLFSTNFNVNELFYIFANNEKLAIYLPMTGIDIVKSIMMILALTYGTAMLLLTKVDKDYSITTKIIFVIVLGASYIINVLASAQGFNGNSKLSYYQLTIMKLVEMAIIIVIAHWRLYKCFGRREKKS